MDSERHTTAANVRDFFEKAKQGGSGSGANEQAGQQAKKPGAKGIKKTRAKKRHTTSANIAEFFKGAADAVDNNVVANPAVIEIKSSDDEDIGEKAAE